MSRLLRLAAALSCAASPLMAQTVSPHHALGREVLKEMLEVNTTDQHGSTTVLANKLATRFRAAGFTDVTVDGVPNTPHHNLIVRWPGTNPALKPILLLSHLDVVEAKREDWAWDPFTMVEKDGYYYARGTMDVKGPGATLVVTLLELKKAGWTPARGLILAMTAGEESGNANGVEWMVAHRRDLLDVAWVLNVDGGGGTYRGGTRSMFNVQAAEKVYQSFTLTARHRGGHSSVPEPGNPIYRLARGLDRLDHYRFPAALNDVTRSYFLQGETIVGGPLGKAMSAYARESRDTIARRLLDDDVVFNALLRTTCVATMLEGGHAENALPQMARATVNCRMLPGSSPDSVRATIARVIADTSIHVDFIGTAVPSPPTALTPDVENALRGVITSMWGKLPLLQMMETGATDGLHLRNIGLRVYGFNGVFSDNEDDRAHGRDERIGIKEYDDAIEFMHRLVRAVAGGSAM